MFFGKGLMRRMVPHSLGQAHFVWTFKGGGYAHPLEEASARVDFGQPAELCHPVGLYEFVYSHFHEIVCGSGVRYP